MGTTAPTLQEQAPKLLGHLAGYVSHRTVSTGLRSGMIEALADGGDGRRPDELAEELGLDPDYVDVWCRAALGAGLCERDGDRYALASHMAALLLDPESPSYLGGVFLVFEQDEVFDRFERTLPTGQRLWWDDTPPDWIAGVARTGKPFYTRLIPDGLDRVPGLGSRLAEGGRIIDTACGAGDGLVRLATHYPECEIVGVDGDGYSLELARQRMAEAGLADRVQLRQSPLERFRSDGEAVLVVNNISMHECRDLDEATRRIRDVLQPGGWFVISDFPYPQSAEGQASVPGRIMTGIQFFEAQIDDQLLPRSAYDDLLERHGFAELGAAELTPVHALTWGRRP